MNERQFSSHFSGFWHTSLPNLESVVRTLNLAAAREQRPLVSRISPDRRDIVSETSFQLARIRAPKNGRGAPDDLSLAFERAVAFLQEPPSRERAIGVLNEEEVRETLVLTDRLLQFARWRLNSMALLQVDFAPRFSGHGALEACEGDIEVDGRLIEVKCVDRAFRSTDFRQVLTYATLAYLSHAQTYASLTLYNSLRGTSITVGTDELVRSSGGKTKEEFFHEVSYALSSGEISR